MKRFFLLLLLWFFFFPVLKSQTEPAMHWADSLLKTMTLREKIAQLIMLPVYSNRDVTYEKAIGDTIEKYQPGLLILFQGSPVRETILLNDWQKRARIPMLVSMDAEWGPAMRLDSIMPFPRLMALAATGDTNLVYQYGKAIGYQCKLLGIHINYAPVVDVNNNPLNPVINYRSFGENQHKVVMFARAFCHGMMSENVLPVAKHFPGHGNTSQDSHKTLPDVTDNAAVVDSVHLFPFREMIADSIWGIMVAHVFVPVLDNTKNQPSSLSKPIITGLLREKYQYNGLIFTDALGMKGVTGKNKPGAIEVKSLIAGNDILTMPENIKVTIDSVERAIKENRIRESGIDSSVMKVLTAKYHEGLTQWTPVETEQLTKRLNQPEFLDLKKEIYAKGVTLLRNENNIVPFIPANRSVAVVSFRINSPAPFHKALARDLRFDTFFIPDTLNDSVAASITAKAAQYDEVICAVHDMSFLASKNYGFYPRTKAIVDSICHHTQVTLCLFGNPYAYHSWKSQVQPDVLLVTYERDTLAEWVAADILTGRRMAEGTLPVSVNNQFKEGFGMHNETLERLTLIHPSDAGYNTSALDSIDRLVLRAIDDGVFPGCQILAAKNGQVFYQKSFGYHTYEKKQLVHNTDVFDLASVSKVLGTTLAIMQLYEENRIALEQPLQEYFPMANGTPCGPLHIDRLLTHSSGLPSWIPLYTATLTNGYPDSAYYRKIQDSVFNIRVCDSMYLRSDYPDSMIHRILHQKILPDQGYKYSDLGFILLKEVIESVSQMPLDSFMLEHFYRPLGLYSMTFNPLQRFPRTLIPPTENDITFRHMLIHGYVHDQAAAMFGGVSGHAGLFSNAWDAAVILQMLLNGGDYAGTRYFRASTIQRFTSTYFDKNRRGLGFDKPSGTKNGNVCEEASPKSFGHSGFTGTFIWADPANGLIYVFLSNRVHPDAENSKITQQNIRTRIHSLLYQAVNQP